MSKRPRVDFRLEAEGRFSFLVTDFGLGAPIYSERILPHLVYQGEVIGYQIGYAPLDKVVSVLVLKEREDGQERYRVPIEKVVVRAGLGQAGDVQTSARSGEKMVSSLENLAYWVRTLHPALVGPDADEILRSPTWPLTQGS